MSTPAGTSCFARGLRPCHSHEEHAAAVQAVQAYLAPGRPPPLPWNILFFEEHVLGRIGAASGRFGKGQPRLYVLSFAGPVPYVKLGRTADIFGRIMRLRHEANMHGAALVDGWASCYSAEAPRWERSLINALPERSPRHSKEYHHGADFQQILALAKKIVERDSRPPAS
ncbi:hypothetical protein V7793_05315 [Streptomyces sp. KLMMK]|uniref:hypothetical protein n=1 Tax=Streptomyces sp. KLMMK TaxID=3109353 RepID=UPI002FFD92AF